MGLLEAVIAAGPIPQFEADRAAKKRYSERLSQLLAQHMGSGLKEVGFEGIRPQHGEPGERAFQGGLGPKKVDVSYADEQHGLLLAVSIKTITSAPFGKNLKNRFYDLCPEGITLHLRFPYSVVCALFCFPSSADAEVSAKTGISTFQRARKLLATISGRQEYTDPGEKFENITMLLFQPVEAGSTTPPSIRLIDAGDGADLTEAEYYEKLRQIYNRRNPHLALGPDALED